jgi:ABC-type microcin C transport system permease subunit YejB
LVFLAFNAFILLGKHKDLVEERSQVGEGAKSWDKLIGIITGIYAARYRGKAFDVASGTVFLAMWSLPVIWVGVVLIALFANRQVFYWFDSSGLHHPRAADMAFFPSAWPPRRTPPLQ